MVKLCAVPVVAPVMTERETLTRDEMAAHPIPDEGWAYDPVIDMYHRAVAVPTDGDQPHGQ